MCFPAFLLLERKGCANQSNMSECLGKVTQSVTAIRINLFGEQAQVVAIIQQLLKLTMRLRQSPSAKRQVFAGGAADGAWRAGALPCARAAEVMHRIAATVKDIFRFDGEAETLAAANFFW